MEMNSHTKESLEEKARNLIETAIDIDKRILKQKLIRVISVISSLLLISQIFKTSPEFFYMIPLFLFLVAIILSTRYIKSGKLKLKRLKRKFENVEVKFIDLISFNYKSKNKNNVSR